ncbi:MAG: flagellar basal-body rod protein FlgF [Pseudomonadota bacterium]
MESSIPIAAAGQQNLQKQLIVIANNMANANTVGFKAEVVDFKHLISRSASEDVHFPNVAKLYPSMQQGGLEQTDNPLDIALTGEGWFAIATPAGTAYTRDGRFTMSEFGELRTLEGHGVLDAGGAPIQLNPNAPPPEILQDGRIFSNSRQVGNIGVFLSPPENFESRYSNSAFLASTPGIPTPVGGNIKIEQGFVEQSNVSALTELASLITISKNYQAVTSMISRVDQTLSKSVTDLSGQG